MAAQGMDMGLGSDTQAYIHQARSSARLLVGGSTCWSDEKFRTPPGSNRNETAGVLFV